MPVRKPVLARRDSGKHGSGLAAERLVTGILDPEQRAHVPRKSVHGADALEAHAPDPLRPQAVLIAPGGESVGRFPGELVPAHRNRGDEGPRCPEHEVVRFVGEIGANARLQVVFEAVTEPARDEKNPRLAGEQCGFARLGKIPGDVGLRAPAFERGRGDGGEVERGLGETAAPELIESEDDACRTDVEVLERQNSLPSVPLVRGPESLRIEGRVGVRNDRRDAVADARFVPRLVGQRLESARVVEHEVERS